MIVTDRMVFLHLHKSGGTFVNHLLRHCVPTMRMIGYHYPYRELPDADRHLPVVGTVRSPWGYYVSWFHFQAGMQQPNVLFRICSDDRRLGFAETIDRLSNLAWDAESLERLEQALPESYEPRGLNLIKRDVGDLRESGLGFYSFLYQRLYQGAAQPMIARMEALREELASALSAVGHLPDPCISGYLAAAPPINVTRHDAPESYFDDRLAGLVAERDRLVIDRYGYTLA